MPTPLFKELQWVGEWCSKGSDLIFSLLTFLVFITSHVLYFLGHPFFSNNISPSVFYFHFAHLISDDFCSHLLLKVMKLIAFLTCTYSLPSLVWLEFGCQLGHLPLPCLCIAKCHKALLHCSSGLLQWLLNSTSYLPPSSLSSFVVIPEWFTKDRFAYVTILLKHSGLATASRMKSLD